MHFGTAWTLFVLVCCGCGGSGGPLKSLSGVVTFDGEPVESGYVRFEDADSAVRGYAAPIRDGKFSLKLEPGEKTIHVTASREVKVAPSPESPSGIEKREYISACYNTESKLTLTIDPAAGDPDPLELTLTTGCD